MNCLPCFNKNDDDGDDQPKPTTTEATPVDNAPVQPSAASSKAKDFNFQELEMATNNFGKECLIGEGGFGKVYKGTLEGTGQVVAVKQLDRKSVQGNKEFLAEVTTLSLFEHPNLVSLIGYCADGDQRLLVYEFMEMRSLENNLFGDDPEKKVLDWYTRMKIASGAANGLEYMHDTTKPSMIYRKLKPSNILLDESYEPKLSDYGLDKLRASGGGDINPSSKVMGTYGYSAPEYWSSGETTLKSDIYSFGVVFLELIAGRRAIDTNRPKDEKNLVTWAKPILREPKRFSELADPRLNREFPVRGLNQAVGMCAMCLLEESSVRPLAGDIVAALSFLTVPLPNDVLASSLTPPEIKTKTFTPPPEQKMNYDKEVSQKRADKDGSREDGDDDENSEESEDEGNRGESSHCSDHSDEEIEYSHSEDESESDHDDDSDNSKHKNAAKELDSKSKKHDAVSGSSKRALSSKKSLSKDEGSKGESSHCSDHSDKENEYSDSDDEFESDHDDDSDNSKHKDAAKELDSKSKKHDARSGSSKRALSLKKSRSKDSKTVVSFKEPNISSKRNDEDGDNRRRTSSSSSESDSESDGEETVAEGQ